jgi:hypothetical protein
MRTLSTLSFFHYALSGEGESTLSTGSLAEDDGLVISRQARPCCLPAENQKRRPAGSGSTSKPVTWRPKDSPEAPTGMRDRRNRSTGCIWLRFV